MGSKKSSACACPAVALWAASVILARIVRTQLLGSGDGALGVALVWSGIITVLCVIPAVLLTIAALIRKERLHWLSTIFALLYAAMYLLKI